MTRIWLIFIFTFIILVVTYVGFNNQAHLHRLSELYEETFLAVDTKDRVESMQEKCEKYKERLYDDYEANKQATEAYSVS